VADDYEIMVRTFLKTRMVRLPKLCYLQYIGNTAQEERAAEIRRHVRSIKIHYDRMIHERFLELGAMISPGRQKGLFRLSHPQP